MKKKCLDMKPRDRSVHTLRLRSVAAHLMNHQKVIFRTNPFSKTILKSIFKADPFSISKVGQTHQLGSLPLEPASPN